MGKTVVKKRTTKKQIDANHVNAKKSTGPRTAEGKARVRLNAIKHGLRAEQVVVLGGPTAEDPAEFDSLLSNMLHDCKPAGALERVLVERLAVSFWRLRRAYRFEARAIERANEPNPMSKMLEELSQLPPHKPGLQELPGLRSLDKLVRYELMIDRELLRTAVQLERLQHTRKLEERRAVPEPGPSGSGPAADPPGDGPQPEGRGSVGRRQTHASASEADSSSSACATAVSAVRPAGQPQGLQPTRAEGGATGSLSASASHAESHTGGLASGGRAAPRRTAGQAASGTPVGIAPDPAKAQWPNKAISQPSASGRTTSVQVTIPARATARPIRRGGPWHTIGCATALEQWSGVRAHRSRVVAHEPVVDDDGVRMH